MVNNVNNIAYLRELLVIQFETDTYFAYIVYFGVQTMGITQTNLDIKT